MFTEEISVPIEEFEVDPAILTKLILVRYENVGVGEMCLLQAWPAEDFYCFYSVDNTSKEDIVETIKEFCDAKEILFVKHTGDADGEVFDIEEATDNPDPYYLARVIL